MYWVEDSTLCKQNVIFAIKIKKQNKQNILKPTHTFVYFDKVKRKVVSILTFCFTKSTAFFSLFFGIFFERKNIKKQRKNKEKRPKNMTFYGFVFTMSTDLFAKQNVSKEICRHSKMWCFYKVYTYILLMLLFQKKQSFAVLCILFHFAFYFVKCTAKQQNIASSYSPDIL